MYIECISTKLLYNGKFTGIHYELIEEFLIMKHYQISIRLLLCSSEEIHLLVGVITDPQPTSRNK